MKSATGALHRGCGSLQETARLPPPPPVYQLSSFIPAACLFAKSPQEIGLAKETATSLTGGSGPPPSWLSGGAGSRARCRAVLWKVGDPSLSASGGGGSKGDAEFAQSTHCTVRFTQLFCSQCKYGQPHSSLALLPQHTSRGEG